MLSDLNKLHNEVSLLVVFCDDNYLAYFIKNIIKTRFKLTNDFMLEVDSDKALKAARASASVPPLSGGIWCIDVDAEKISQKTLASEGVKLMNGSLTVLWFNKYITYKKFIDLKGIQSLGNHVQKYYFGRLDTSDIDYLQENIVPKTRHLPKPLLNFVKKGYTYDVGSVMELMNRLKNGEIFETRTDIINAVGIGGNTVDSFTISLLTLNFNTLSGRKTVLKRLLRALDGLGTTYKYSTVKNYMGSTLDAMIELKELQISGVLNKPVRIIPETYDEKKIKRLRRFEYLVLNEISLPKILNLRICLSDYDSYDAKMDLIRAIYTYTLALKADEEIPNKKRESKPGRGSKSSKVVVHKDAVEKVPKAKKEEKKVPNVDGIIENNADKFEAVIDKEKKRRRLANDYEIGF